MCGLDPHPGQVAGCWLGGVVGGCLRCLTARMAPGVLSHISLCCFFAASCALHIVMAASCVRSGCLRSCSIVSPSGVPSMIWSRIFF